MVRTAPEPRCVAELENAPASPPRVSPTQINLLRTMRNSFGRRLALRRPKLAEIKALEEDIAILESEASPANSEKLLALKAELDRQIARRKWVSYIDPVDVRFNAFSEQPQPTSQAVMFV